MKIRFVNRKMRRAAKGANAAKVAWYEDQWHIRYERFEMTEMDRFDATANDRFDEAYLGYAT